MKKQGQSTVAGIDLGTQSIKVILYDYENRVVVGEASRPLKMISRDDGTREQEAAWYLQGLIGCFSDFSDLLKETISAVGVSGQQHGFVPLDEAGDALYRIKLWNDTSTEEECRELAAAAGGPSVLFDRIGNLMLPGYTAPKVLWLKKNLPEAFSKLRHILLPHDYVNFYLTGKYTAEYGDASGTALFDVRQRVWADDICGLIDQKVLGCLPGLVQPGSPAGFSGPKAARELGLPEGIPVSAGGGDNMMAAVGTGTVSDGFLTMSLGTSGTLFGYSEQPVIDLEGRIAAFCSSTGGWLPLLCTMNCTVATEQARELFGVDLKLLEEEAAKSPAGAEGVITLPFYNGERIPNLPNGRASINGLTSLNCSRRNILRSAMESAIFGLRNGLDAFRSLGFSPREIRLTGGGSKSPVWRSIAANVMNLPVKVPLGTEAAAFGAALQALSCRESLEGSTRTLTELVHEHVEIETASTLYPEQSIVKVYEAAYAQYGDYLRALRPLFE